MKLKSLWYPEYATLLIQAQRPEDEDVAVMFGQVLMACRELQPLHTIHAMLNTLFERMFGPENKDDFADFMKRLGAEDEQ